MSRLPRLLALGLLASIQPLLAQTHPVEGESPLTPLAFLVGKWVEGPVGMSTSDRDWPRNHLELAWDLGGQVIRRSEARSDDGDAWLVTGLIAWNPVSQRIEFQEHNARGNFVRGTIDVLREGVVQRNLEVSYPDGTTASWRTIVRATSENSFRGETEKLVDGVWQRQWEKVAKRVATFPWE